MCVDEPRIRPIGGPALVTGATGWLGSRMAEFLAQDAAAPPRCFVLSGQKRALAALAPRLELVEGDLRSPADCGRFCSGMRDAVLYHCAGVIHPRRVREYYEVNVNGVRNLLTAAAKAGVRRAVIVSSNSPCGCNPHPDHLFDEFSPYNPYMHYGRSKMHMELLVRELHASGTLESVIIRAPWFYGPNQPPRQSLFFEMIREGRVPVVGGGQCRRSMAYIDNLCAGLLLAAREPRAAGQTYWIADKRPYTWNEVIETIERVMENDFSMPVRRGRLPLPGIAADVARATDRLLQAAGLYHQKIHVLSETNQDIACSIARAQAEIGYDPRIALAEGMRRSIAWCIAQGQMSAGGA
ncbi:MAG: NAD(P)-dependent oxidoreductase [Elusimicrobiota bacterium]